VKKVLVDGRELLFEGHIQLSNYLCVPAHAAASFARAGCRRKQDIVRDCRSLLN
jgi:hypothetical protein